MYKISLHFKVETSVLLLLVMMCILNHAVVYFLTVQWYSMVFHLFLRQPLKIAGLIFKASKIQISLSYHTDFLRSVFNKENLAYFDSRHCSQGHALSLGKPDLIEQQFLKLCHLPMHNKTGPVPYPLYLQILCILSSTWPSCHYIFGVVLQVAIDPL